MAGGIDVAGLHRPVQPFVEQQVGRLRQGLPRRKGAGLLLVGCRFLRVVQVFAGRAGPRLAVVLEERFDLFEQVGVGAEMAEARQSLLLGLRQPGPHLGAVVAVIGVALDDGG